MPAFRLAKQTRLYEEVAAQLRAAIISREYAPGARLPTELELAADFGVSRAVIRQATMSLEHDGLVEVHVGAAGGTIVREPGVEALCRALENVLRWNRVNVRDYLQVKRLLEPALADGIFRNAKPEQCEALLESLTRFREHITAGADEALLLHMTLEFHELLIQCTDNELIEAIMLALVRMGERMPEFRMTERDWNLIADEHHAILDAMQHQQQRRFTGLMLSHLDTVRDIYQNPTTEDVDPATKVVAERERSANTL